MRSKGFLRYMLSYLLVLLLPLLLFFFSFAATITEQYRTEIVKSNARTLKQIQENLDGHMEQLIKLAYMIQQDSAVQPSKIAGDITSQRKAVSQLSTYNSILSLPEMIIVYRSGDDYCYTSSSVITPKKLLQEQFVYENHSLEDFLSAIDDPSSLLTWPADSISQFGGHRQKYLTVFLSVGSGNVSPKQRVIYLVPTEKLSGNVFSSEESGEASFLIADKNGQALLSYGSLPLTDFMGQEPESVQKLNGEDVFFTGSTSPVTGWQYSMAIPASAVEQNIRTALRNMVFLLLSIILAGGVIVYLLSRKIYQPIQKLTEKARAYGAVSSDSKEIQQVESVLDALSAESHALRKTLEDSKKPLLESRLADLLEGNGNPQETLQALREGGVFQDEHAIYQVLLIENREKDSALQEKIRTDICLAEAQDQPEILICSKIAERKLTAIVFSVPKLTNDVISLNESMGGGLSLPVPQKELPEAYRQAKTALQHGRIHGCKAILIYSQDMESPASMRNYPQQQLEALQWHLLQQDLDAFRTCLKTTMDGIQRDTIPFSMARMACLDAANITVRTLISLGGSSKPDIPVEKVEQLAAFSTISEFTQSLNRFVEETMPLLHQAEAEKSGNERIRKMKHYIESECFDCNFSLQQMADYFELTASNLSHYFKTYANVGVMEYVQELRKNEACRLLKTTSAPVQEVGAAVGMPNVSSFIRSFRQLTGFTPGQYRKNQEEA